MRKHMAVAAMVTLLVALAGCSSAAETTTPGTTPPPTSLHLSPAATKSREPSPTPTIQDVMELEEFAPLDPGTYFIDPDLDPSTPLRVTYEVPSEGWSQWTGAAKWDDKAKRLDAVAITTVTNLVRDGCLDHSYAEPPVGPSVDDLASGLAELAPFRVTSRPKDVTIYGYRGKHLELTVPDMRIDHEGFVGCIGGNLNGWVGALDAVHEDGESFGSYTGPGYREEFWILNVEGTRLVIATERSPGLPSRDLAEQQAILDSIRIEPGSDAAPIGSILRGAGEVLLFTATQDEARGDLIAVTPGTGAERVLVKDVAHLYEAKWSADGRWVAFEMSGSLWVIDRTLDPRQVFEGGEPWVWSPTGARLAVIRGSTLFVVDPSTGQTKALASTVGDVTSAPAWSPDGSRIVFGARGGAIYSVDMRTGKRSRVVRLPGEHLDSIDGIAWSPAGSRLAVYNDLVPGSGRLFVLNSDGSHIRVLADDELVFGFDWSPDGSRIVFTEDYGPEVNVMVAPADGSSRSLVASLPNGWGNPVWSPDGSRIALGSQSAFLTEDAHDLVIDADGSGDAVPIDDLTYESWLGGSYDCACDLFG